jgi:hypothetical protein
MLAVTMVGVALITHLTPLAIAWVFFPQVGGDDMTKGLAQLFIVYFTAWFALLAVVDPVWSYLLLYRTRRRNGTAADAALLLAASAATLPPVLLMGVIFLALVCGKR